jgi:hypothetical protein
MACKLFGQTLVVAMITLAMGHIVCGHDIPVGRESLCEKLLI